MIKSQDINKFYIKQFVLNEDSFQDWYMSNLHDLTIDNAIIGYLFSTKPGLMGNDVIKVVNIYLIKRKYYNNQEVTKDSLEQNWKLFFNKCKNETDFRKRMVFVNPPIQQWLDTKENWCKKMATKLSNIYGKSYYDTLSDVYYTIMSCYAKGNVYMGNLNYLERSMHNTILIAIRHDKIRVSQDSGLAISAHETLNDTESGEITILDLFESNDDSAETTISYKEFEHHLSKLLLKSFSVREVDQLMHQPLNCLPNNLYRKLTRWRKQHSKEEVYGVKGSYENIR